MHPNRLGWSSCVCVHHQGHEEWSAVDRLMMMKLTKYIELYANANGSLLSHFSNPYVL